MWTQNRTQQSYVHSHYATIATIHLQSFIIVKRTLRMLNNDPLFPAPRIFKNLFKIVCSLKYFPNRSMGILLKGETEKKFKDFLEAVMYV